MLHLLVASIIAYTAYAVDYCGWNRAVKPVDENNGGTFNFINGPFVRDFSVSSGGQTDVWQGMPYYKMTLTTCYIPVLWLYRHSDHSVWPPVNTWVISASVGTKPTYGYAYCGASTGVTTDPATPDGACDGNWYIGQPTETHLQDLYFKVLVGGCPQVTCSSIIFKSNSADNWARNSGQGTFDYVSPNVYKQTNNDYSENTADGGTYYLFWSYKMWRWAINEYIDDYENCELYKGYKGFTSVADVNIDGQINSIPPPGDEVYYRKSTCDTCSRRLACTGTVATPAPTARHATVPTQDPVAVKAEDICQGGWGSNSPSKVLKLCGNTPSPVVVKVFTGTPTGSPITTTSSGSSGSSQTTAVSGPSGSSQTTSSGSSANTAYPTIPGTARPTAPTTGAPTDSKSRTASPTAPTTAAPTSKGVVPGGTGNNGNGNGDGDGDSNANTINCNMYLLCILITIYKLLF